VRFLGKDERGAKRPVSPAVEVRFLGKDERIERERRETGNSRTRSGGSSPTTVKP